MSNRQDDYYDDDDDNSYSQDSRGSRSRYSQSSRSRTPSPRRDAAPQHHDDDDEHESSVLRHAKFLGIDPVADADYLWIAEEALDAELPEGWVSGEGEGEYEGLIYYFNEATGTST
jgi:hypothetical protein